MNSEYLVYNKDGSPLTADEEAAIYKILATYPFPLSSNPLNADALAQLSPAQRAKLDHDEPALILEKIQEINPNLDIILFPKSLQQFYLYAATQGVELSATHAELMQSLSKLRAKSVAGKEEKYEITDFENIYKQIRKNQGKGDLNATAESLHILATTWKELGIPILSKNHNVTDYSMEFYSLCKKSNENPAVFAVWRELNAALIEEFRLIGRQQASADILKHFADEWTAKHIAADEQFSKQDTNDQEYQLTFAPYMYEPNQIELLNHILKFEIDCMFDPQISHLYIAYRGSVAGYDSDLLLLQRETNHSLSFGNGILEASINDIGACAFNYMGTEAGDQSGFALLFDQSVNGVVIMVPPLTSVAKTLGGGDMVHPRSMPAQNQHGVHQHLLHNTIMLTDRRNGSAIYVENIFGDRTSLAHYLAFGSNDASQGLARSTQQTTLQPLEVDRFSAILVFLTFLAMGVQIHRWFNNPAPTAHTRRSLKRS